MGLSGTLMMGLPVCVHEVGDQRQEARLPGAEVRRTRRRPTGPALVAGVGHAEHGQHDDGVHRVAARRRLRRTCGPTSPPAEATMSSGLCRLQNGGRISSSSASSSAGSSASVRPCRATSSAASTPAPPPLVTTATRRPLGSGSCRRGTCRGRRLPAMDVQVMTPACRAAASQTAAEPAMAPVCDAAALPPYSVRPVAQHDDRLLAAGALRDVQEAPAVVDALEVGHDARWCRRRRADSRATSTALICASLPTLRNLSMPMPRRSASVDSLHAEVARLRDEAQRALGAGAGR